MDSYHKSKCHKIIHTAAATASATAAGLAQIPGSDAIPITAIQVGMIISLGAVFGKEISKSVAKSILGGATAAIGGRTVSQFLVGWIPGLGNAINAATAASITEALGWYVANDFAAENERESALAAEALSAGIRTISRLTSSQIFTPIIFSVALALLCMLVDAGLEKFTVHFKIWGAVSGILLVVAVNYGLFTVCRNNYWTDKARAMMSYTDYLALVINVVCALVARSGNDVRGWDEAVAEFFRTPLLNWGLVIAAVFWALRIDRRICEDWEYRV